MCQDTGTAIISGVRGDQVFVDGDDGEALARGVGKSIRPAICAIHKARFPCLMK